MSLLIIGRAIYIKFIIRVSITLPVHLSSGRPWGAILEALDNDDVMELVTPPVVFKSSGYSS